MSFAQNMRKAYGEALVELGTKNKTVVALDADLSKSTQSAMFGEKFPERFFEMGIAEQNMASTSAGFALTGKIPFMHSFAVFAAGRAYDQLRNSVCIPKLKVRICGSSSGLSDFGDGKTHQSIEDMSIMRALPNMTVLCPADGIEAAKMVAQLDDYPGPVYIRINRNDLPFVFPEDQDHRIGKAWTLREGQDAVIYACGVMVSKALEAAEALRAEGVETRVVNVSTIKPIDRDGIIAAAEGARSIVVAEEHTVMGGLGSAVLEALRGVAHAPVEFVGVEDSYGCSAEEYEGLLRRYGLTADAVKAGVLKFL